jgi:hypothetical protein
MTATRTQSATFRVLDVLNAPHGGKILRLRLHSGEAPTVKTLKGARMKAVAPDGSAERYFRVDGFAVFGGRPSDERFSRTGRIDVHVVEEGPGSSRVPPVSLRWEVFGPLRD